ncbi:vitamin B12 transporter [Janthinobacterium sp. CG_23.3]|uniref:TonB-dependent receptor plug domain-containing protein n=1 Tax=Janthinobacterium sp. CG_23.3 TaxID=3349634 RepID=UPI0038D38EA3
MTSPVSRHAAITSLALAIAAPGAFAQNPSEKIDAVIVTASRSAQPASEVLSDTVVISAEQIARSGAVSVVDLLQKQRGVEVARNGGAGTNASVFIRGANSNQNIVLVDGVRIGSSTSGAANWSALPLSAIDHIEIVYGPLSTMYGADAIGGVVQIFTKKGQRAPHVGAFVGAGSDATRQFDASVAGASGGEHSFSYALTVGKEKSDGFSATNKGNYSYNPDKDGYDKESATGQFGLELAKGHDIGLLFLQSRLDSQYDNGTGAYDARTHQKLGNLAVFTKNQILPNWTIQFQVAEARDKAGTDASARAGGKAQLDTVQTDVTLQNNFKIGADTLQILFEHRKEEVESNSPKELSNQRSTKSVAASYSLKRERHLASVSVRGDDSTQYGSTTTGALGYGYRINAALRANASFGTSFRAPTFNELYYPGFGLASNQPEKGRNAEVGLHFDDGTTQLGAVYFHNRITDLLVSNDFCPVEQNTHPYGCVYNVNKALLEGVSLSARRQLGAFSLSGSLDLQDPRDETTGKALLRRAKRHASFSAEYSAGALVAGAELLVSGKRTDYGDAGLPGYGLINLFATYQVAPDWSLLARWNNATDKQYELAQHYGTGGATVFLGLRYGMK